MCNNVVSLASLMCVLLSGICMAEPVDVAAPNPADGSVAVATSVKLSWSEGDKAQEKEGYLLFVGTNKTEVTESFFRNHPNVESPRGGGNIVRTK
jgi:hypothetical protein